MTELCILFTLPVCKNAIVMENGFLFASWKHFPNSILQKKKKPGWTKINSKAIIYSIYFVENMYRREHVVLNVTIPFLYPPILLFKHYNQLNIFANILHFVYLFTFTESGWKWPKACFFSPLRHHIIQSVTIQYKMYTINKSYAPEKLFFCFTKVNWGNNNNWIVLTELWKTHKSLSVSEIVLFYFDAIFEMVLSWWRKYLPPSPHTLPPSVHQHKKYKLLLIVIWNHTCIPHTHSCRSTFHLVHLKMCKCIKLAPQCVQWP